MLRRLLLVLFLAVPLQTHAQTYRAPFHSVNGMILLDAQVNGKPAVFLLDTGSNVSFVDMHSAPLRFKAEKVRRIGMTGCIVAHPKLVIAGKDFSEQRFCIADLSDVSKEIGQKVDGFIGQDVLREFSAVRIDYKAGLVEFEK
jgi:hypothetical protein